jgi:hypothetical protein
MKLIATLPLLFLLAAPALAAEMRPNVLFVYADDLGWGDLSGGGIEDAPLPRLATWKEA